jgi:hypothetical protein
MSASYNNRVYNNTILHTINITYNTTRIYVIGDPSGNKIYNNTIMNAESGLTSRNIAMNNMVYVNNLIDVKSQQPHNHSRRKLKA